MSFAPKHIFVPVDADLSGDRLRAEQVVDDAVDLAHVLGARLTLGYVARSVTGAAMPLPDRGDSWRAMTELLDASNIEASRLLSNLKARAEERGVRCDAVIVARAGRVPELLLETASQIGSDLVVMATHGRRGWERLLLGSVAERTAHLSSIPVMLLPSRDDVDHGSEGIQSLDPNPSQPVT